jgi:hypothetical protein
MRRDCTVAADFCNACNARRLSLPPLQNKRSTSPGPASVFVCACVSLCVRVRVGKAQPRDQGHGNGPNNREDCEVYEDEQDE